VTTEKLHDGEVDIDDGIVHGLLLTQFPQWAALPLHRVNSTGTVNAIYRLGDDMYVRLPRVHRWAGGLQNELRWLPTLAPQLPLAVPEPVATGEPDAGYPFSWAVYRWLEGETFAIDRVRDEGQDAVALAQFISSMRNIDPSGAPQSTRARSLSTLDAETRTAIVASGALVDPDATLAAWETGLHGPAWTGTPVWTHGDLIPPNLLVHDGRLRAVIDFGSVGAGDPAVDVIPAWSVFGTGGREAFRSALDVDEDTWVRSRGLALHQALLIIPYYRETNPDFVTMAIRTVEHVLADSRELR
jgi:aminoglycoside phosphotransferase (APT) family kinase protein